MFSSLLILFSVAFAAGSHEGSGNAFANPMEQAPATRASSTEKPEIINKIGIIENLGAQLPLDLNVTNENNESVPLRSFFHKDQPVVLSLVYYSCPGLCNFHLNGFFEALKNVEWSPGNKFQLLALSFDAKEKSDLAKAKKETYLKLYGRPGTEGGIHFLTADEDTVKAIASTVGFNFVWDDKEQQWAHGSAAVMISPEGKITRYLHGVIFEPNNIRLALTEAGQGKTGSFVDQMVMYCFKYDPKQSKYVLYAFRLVQLGGGLIVLILGLLLIPAWIRSRREV